MTQKNKPKEILKSNKNDDTSRYDQHLETSTDVNR